MNKYIYDSKKRESWIESDEMKCCTCKKSFIEGETVHLGISSKRTRCEKCAKFANDIIESDIMFGDVEWRPGQIKEAKK